MRCYYVLVHGMLTWKVASSEDDAQPPGFYCHRYVLASNRAAAAQKALNRVRANLDRKTGWLSGGNAIVVLEADEVSLAPMHYLLKAEDRGHTFYRGG